MRLRISLQLEIGLMRNSDSLDVPDKNDKTKAYRNTAQKYNESTR